ncbi:MAG: hypothetical protein R6V45_07450 [Oceanipulchritudo sp.]
MSNTPSKKTARKTGKPAVARKTIAHKDVAKKSTVKKTAARKTPAKKSVPGKTPVKKKATTKIASKKVATRKTTARKTPARKAARREIETPQPIVTTVVAKVDAGFGNVLTIRGNSSGLTWDAGALMENTSADEWIWRSTSVTSELEFKVLLNDEVWSAGPNGVVFPGATVVFEPVFE